MLRQRPSLRRERAVNFPYTNLPRSLPLILPSGLPAAGYPDGSPPSCVPVSGLSSPVFQTFPSVPCRTKVMRIVHKCRRQGSGSASPKGRARALAPSQSYRFVNNSHDLPTDGRRPQISPEISSCLCKVGRAKSPQSSGRSPGEAVGEIIPCLELAQAEFITKQRSPAASWLDLKQLTEPHEFILASSPLQDREKP